MQRDCWDKQTCQQATYWWWVRLTIARCVCLFVCVFVCLLVCLLACLFFSKRCDIQACKEHATVLSVAFYYCGRWLQQNEVVRGNNHLLFSCRSRLSVQRTNWLAKALAPLPILIVLSCQLCRTSQLCIVHSFSPSPQHGLQFFSFFCLLLWSQPGAFSVLKAQKLN